MIKVGIVNPYKGRNIPTFKPFFLYRELFKEIGIEFVNPSNTSYDFMFIGMEDFIYKKLPLSKSIDKGVKNVNKYSESGPVFLFDGSDSTSLMGSIEVLRKTNSLKLFKNQLLDFHLYSQHSTFNKWFFGSNDEPKLRYNIGKEEQKRIMLSGYNIGTLSPSNLYIDNRSLHRDVDVCGIFQTNHKQNSDHTFRNDHLYTSHREKVNVELNKLPKKINIEKDRQPFEIFINILRRSKCTVSPFGMGEVCFRDFESIKYGSLLIKPDMGKVKTEPNIYIPYETYLPCSLDYSDLTEKVRWVMDNPKKVKEIVQNSQKVMLQEYSPVKFIRYWYNFFLSLEEINTE